MLAIAEINGKQYQFEEGRYLDVDLMASSDPEATIVLDKVQLVIADKVGTVIGKPYIAGASITLKVERHFQAKKVIVFKQKPKKGTRKKQGSRHQLTRVQVEAITCPA
jgi:large subunit ribosomal protein L21